MRQAEGERDGHRRQQPGRGHRERPAENRGQRPRRALEGGEPVEQAGEAEAWCRQRDEDAATAANAPTAPQRAKTGHSGRAPGGGRRDHQRRERECPSQRPARRTRRRSSRGAPARRSRVRRARSSARRRAWRARPCSRASRPRAVRPPGARRSCRRRRREPHAMRRPCRRTPRRSRARPARASADSRPPSAREAGRDACSGAARVRLRRPRGPRRPRSRGRTASRRACRGHARGVHDRAQKAWRRIVFQKREDAVLECASIGKVIGKRERRDEGRCRGGASADHARRAHACSRRAGTPSTPALRRRSRPGSPRAR